jgi:hypothetical protein
MNLDLLSVADPARDVPVPPGDVEALLRRAAVDVTSYEMRLPGRRRRALVAVAAGVAVVAVTGATVAVLADRPSAGPGTPQLSPPAVEGHCLDGIAAAVRAAPYDGRTGRYEYLRRSGLSGSTAQLQDGRFASLRYEAEVSTWTAADGSQVRRTVTRPPTYADEASRIYFRDHPAMLPRLGVATEHVPPGQLSRPQLPPADPQAMADALYQPRDNGPSQALIGAAELTAGRVLDRPHRAALLRFLARTEGVACRGEATDPTGRTGVAVIAPVGKGSQPSPGDQGAEMILVDPATGEILASSYVDGAGTTWVSLYLERGFTDEVPSG